MDEERLTRLLSIIERRNINIAYNDAGDSWAGSICVVKEYKNKEGEIIYKYDLSINKNHTPPVQFSTLSHELAHLYLGHLGGNKKLKIPNRNTLSHNIKEIEAESVAFLVCQRSGVITESEKYLSQFTDGKELPAIRVHQIMKATGQIEQLLGLEYTTKFDKPHECRVSLQNNTNSTSIGVDNQVMLAITKVGAFSLVEGSVKFVPWAHNVLATGRDIGIKIEDIKPLLKSAYGAIAYSPSCYEISAEIVAEMDLPSAVFKVDIDHIIQVYN